MDKLGALAVPQLHRLLVGAKADGCAVAVPQLAGLPQVKWSALLVALVPPAVTTLISTVLELPAREMAVIWVGLLTV